MRGSQESRPRILVAEDEDEIRSHIVTKIREILPQARVTEVANGTDAIAKISLQKFDLVITDLVMPRRDGLAVLTAISKMLDPQLKPEHVLVISGQMLPFHAHGPLGAIPTLEKPLDTRAFQAHLYKLFLQPPATKRPEPAAPAPPKVDPTFLVPFIEGVLKTVPLSCRIHPVRERVYIRPEQHVSGDISAIVAVIGSKHVGSMSLSFPGATFLNLVSGMLGANYQTLLPEIRDAAAEICNQVYGYAKTVLTNRGINVQPAIPTVIANPRHCISHPAAAPIFVVEFSSTAGPFLIETAIQDF